MNDSVLINGNEYMLLQLLGHGKGGYSYRARREADGSIVCVKQIHHEPCDYYQFGNKIEAEANDYKRLREAEIKIPELIEIDFENERLAKEYIDGRTIFDMVKDGEDVAPYIEQVRKMAAQAKSAGLNIDYFPTNFIVRHGENGGELFYIDYECNAYMDKWNFENWGIKYWSQTKEFVEYMERSEQCKN